MLGLKLATDPNWINVAESNLDRILSDHAWCEQKAASNAINLVVGWPEHTDLVDEMLSIAKEELGHFEMVHAKLKERGLRLEPARHDDYVNELHKFMRKGYRREIVLIDRLLFAAMIEARSCERFRILSENLKDGSLREFYRELMISEANHYTCFTGFARKYGEGIENVDLRWKQWLAYEGEVVSRYGKQESIHG
jgi:tRNA-(ms[2]io[6]A)-hydroxylase